MEYKNFVIDLLEITKMGDEVRTIKYQLNYKDDKNFFPIEHFYFNVKNCLYFTFDGKEFFNLDELLFFMVNGSILQNQLLIEFTQNKKDLLLNYLRA